MLAPAPEVIEIEKRATEARLAMAPVLAEAGVAPSTWWRWRKGRVEPGVGNLRKVAHAIDRRIAANDTTPSKGKAA